ncbi:MAG: YitT family protein [Firmicutes bacterium]|nr:YitT family protein [Bacillota bacterium]
MLKDLLHRINSRKALTALTGSIIVAFAMYNIHAAAGLTEGGILGLTLLIYNLWGPSPAVTSLGMNVLCYIFGWRTLGRDFLIYSFIATAGFSLSYALFEAFPPLFPGIAGAPLTAAIVGGLLVGVGAGLCVRVEGAASGEDALAMSVARRTGLGIQWVYLIMDVIVMCLSLTYIPWQRIIFSLLTVVISGQTVGLVARLGQKRPERVRA